MRLLIFLFGIVPTPRKYFFVHYHKKNIHAKQIARGIDILLAIIYPSPPFSEATVGFKSIPTLSHYRMLTLWERHNLKERKKCMLLLVQVILCS